MSSNEKLYYPIEKIRGTFSRVASTSFYKVAFPISGGLKKWLTQTGFYKIKNGNGLDPIEAVELLCSAAILPGTSFKMTETLGNRQGVLEKYPVFKQYPELALTFYVDTDHNVIKFFEEWSNYISPLYTSKGKVDTSDKGLVAKQAKNENNYFKMRYPNEYTQTIYITKFERDMNALKPTGKGGKGNYKFGTSPVLTYEFVKAYPSNIIASAVAYEGTSVLSLTVNFVYSRYFINTSKPTTNNSIIIPDLKTIDVAPPASINNPNTTPSTTLPTQSPLNLDGVDQIFSIQPIA